MCMHADSYMTQGSDADGVRSENRLPEWCLSSNLPREGTSIAGSAVHECLNVKREKKKKESWSEIDVALIRGSVSDLCHCFRVGGDGRKSKNQEN